MADGVDIDLYADDLEQDFAQVIMAFRRRRKRFEMELLVLGKGSPPAIPLREYHTGTLAFTRLYTEFLVFSSGVCGRIGGPI